MGGWIKIHRKMVNWEWYNDNNTKVLFLHLLLTANHKEQKWQGITILRGQKLTSLQHLADETHLSVKQVRVALDKLKRTNEVTTKGTNRYTLVTIEKYSDYQDYDEENGKQSGNPHGSPEGKQRATNKNNKEYKEVEEVVKEKTADEKNYLKCYMENINPLITPYEIEMLNSYTDDLEEELIIKAIQDAVAHNVRTLAYVKSILNRYVNQGISKIEQLNILEKQKETKNNNNYEKEYTFSTDDLTEEQLERYLNNKMTKEELIKILEEKNV